MLRKMQSWSDEMKIKMEFDYDEGETVAFSITKKKTFHEKYGKSSKK